MRFLPGVSVDPRDLKKSIRAATLARRDALDPIWRIEASLAMAEAGFARLAAGRGAVVSGFWPMRSEIDPRPLLDRLRAAGARIVLPAILDRETIVFRELVRGAELVEMGFGTVGPGPNAAVLDPDTMLVPLSAFDTRGYRIGYGGGYYDRAIARLHAAGREPLLVGVAFDCQEVPETPAEAHDVALHAVVTETGWRDFGGTAA